jgi:RNA-binding motif X-linked protein 2
MNGIRATQQLNQRELEECIPPEASWHRDYADTAFIYIGGLDPKLSEGDIIAIFSQYGEPVYLNLVRDKNTGDPKGFAFLKYEDQRSCDLAVDNLGGATVEGRMLRVDHTRYKPRDDEDITKDNTKPTEEPAMDSRDRHQNRHKRVKDHDDSDESSRERKPRRVLIKEEEELQKMMEEIDDEDPMKGALIARKQKEVDRALRKQKKEDRRQRHERKHRNRSRSRSPRRQRSRSRQDDRNRDKRRRHTRSPS